MKYLLDTHIILWAALDVKRLSRKAKNLLENPENILYFSPVSLWEISIKQCEAS
jgi:PIN domain nuclease of toxin-antitoxin system